MNNSYRKDKSYIKQRLEYVSSVDYISALEEQIENLQKENEILKKEILINKGYDIKIILDKDYLLNKGLLVKKKLKELKG